MYIWYQYNVVDSEPLNINTRTNHKIPSYCINWEKQAKAFSKDNTGTPGDHIPGSVPRFSKIPRGSIARGPACNYCTHGYIASPPSPRAIPNQPLPRRLHLRASYTLNTDTVLKCPNKYRLKSHSYDASLEKQQIVNQ